jgi:hypothetical protein
MRLRRWTAASSCGLLAVTLKQQKSHCEGSFIFLRCREERSDEVIHHPAKNPRSDTLDKYLKKHYI